MLPTKRPWWERIERIAFPVVTMWGRRGTYTYLSLLACAVLLLLWAKDVRNDRKHTVSVNMTTPVFVGSGGDKGCNGTQLTTVERGAKLPVRRIRYLKDCAAIDVVLPDGRTGYVVLGTGDVTVNPPLPTI